VSVEGGFGGEIVVAPNPAHDRFVFTVTGLGVDDLQVALLDLQGRVCREWQFEGASAGVNAAVDAGQLAKGVYFLRFRAGDRMELRKVILE
jgi:hypothetical protein